MKNFMGKLAVAVAAMTLASNAAAYRIENISYDKSILGDTIKIVKGSCNTSWPFTVTKDESEYTWFYTSSYNNGLANSMDEAIRLACGE